MSDIERRRDALSPAKQALLRARIAHREQKSRQSRTIPRRSSRDEAPLSSGQERIWLHGQRRPGSVAYNRPANIRLRGPLQAERLRQALAAVVARHESLRTSVRLARGAPSLCVDSHILVEMPFTDLSSQPAPGRRARQMAQDEACRPFGLQQGSLLRSHLLRIDQEDHLLLLTFHLSPSMLGPSPCCFENLPGAIATSRTARRHRWTSCRFSMRTSLCGNGARSTCRSWKRVVRSGRRSWRVCPSLICLPTFLGTKALARMPDLPLSISLWPLSPDSGNWLAASKRRCFLHSWPPFSVCCTDTHNRATS